MASTAQQLAYKRYQESKTEGTKQELHDPQVLHSSFVNLMNHFREPDPLQVSVGHLGRIPFSKEGFYRSLLSETFHVYWSPTGTSSGSGNTLLVSLRRDDASGHYKLTYQGFTEHPQTFTLENPSHLLSSKSFSLEEGLVRFYFRLNGESVNKAPVIVHEIQVGGRNYARYELVPFDI